MTETAVVPFAVQSYQSRSLPWSAQRIVNWYVQTAPPSGMTKSPVVLVPRYAKERFATLAGACRGSYRMGATLYTVFGTKFYSVDVNGAATEIGGISGIDPVMFADNGTQLSISAGGNAYLYDGVTFSGPPIDSSSVAYSNGYFVHSVPGISGEFIWSAVDDGMTFDPLDFANAESNGDELIRIIEHQQEFWMFGRESIEVWTTTGNADSALERIQSVTIEQGTIAKFSISKVGDAVMWIADDRTVRRAVGYTPVRVSTDAIDKVLAESENIANVRSSMHVEDGHAFYTITSIEDGWTFSFDTTTGLWAERSSTDLDWWNAFFPVNIYGAWIVGDDDGGLFKLKPNFYEDDDSTISFEATSAPFFRSTARIDMPRFEVVIEAGVGLTSGQGVDPQIMLQWSDDGGHSWSNEHWRSMGAIGNRRYRAIWRQLGQFQSRIFKVVVTDPVKPIIHGAYADFEILPP